jgi:hypothetical protein
MSTLTVIPPASMPISARMLVGSASRRGRMAEALESGDDIAERRDDMHLPTHVWSDQEKALYHSAH